MLSDSAEMQYLRTLLHGEAFLQIDTFSVEVVSTTISHVNRIILVLGMYLFAFNDLSKKIAQCAAE